MSLETTWKYDFGEWLESQSGFRGTVEMRHEWIQRNGNTRTRYFLRSSDGGGMWFRLSALRPLQNENAPAAT